MGKAKKASSLDERQEEMETALREMIDVIENYFMAAPFTVIEGFEGSPGEYLFPTKIDWRSIWTRMLFPWVQNEEDLGIAAERFGFVFGVLVGCKAMGATREQLIEKSRGFVVPEIGRARWAAGSKEKSHA
jgi:hypothetical protein